MFRHVCGNHPAIPYHFINLTRFTAVNVTREQGTHRSPFLGPRSFVERSRKGARFHKIPHSKRAGMLEMVLYLG